MQLENVADIYPLSAVQQGMLFHSLGAPKSGVYIEQYACKLQGELRIPQFQQAWQQVIDRQPVLRTAFLWEGLDQPLQVVRQQVDGAWAMADWRDYSAVEQGEKLAAFLSCDRSQGFDLLQAPICRFKLIQLRDNSHQFIWSFHHILADGWSIPIIWREVLTCYSAHCRQVSSDLPPQTSPNPDLPPPRPYRDYIAWLQNQDLAAAETFWRKQLQGCSAPTPLPAARTTTTHGLPQSPPYGQQTRTLAPDLYQALQTFARHHRLTLNTLIQGAWALLLSHYSHQTAVTYGSVVSGRPPELQGVETMVGLFINTLPVHVSLDPTQPLLPWLQARQQQLLALRQYEATPLNDIQRWSPLANGSPLFDSIVVFENYPAAPQVDLGFTLEDIRYLEQSNYPLALLVVPGESLDLLLLYDSARFEAEAIPRLHDHLELLLTAFVAQPQAPLAELPRLTAAEQQQFSPGAPTADPDLTIHQLIAAQGQQTPTVPAVVFADQTLTYAELNHTADQLAHWLRDHGVGPNDRVALCLQPSLARIVAILAVLKANGAYVPLDPTYPVERLAYCLKDTAPKFILTQGTVHLPKTSVPYVYLTPRGQLSDSPPPPQAPCSPCSPAPNLAQPQDLAYIIYTSGSTGTPKGVMVSHGNLIHSTLARSQVYPDPVGRYLLLSSIAFDSSVAGIFWTLCQGGTLVLPPDRIEQDLQQLAQLIQAQQITHTLCVPTLYSLLLASANPQQLSTLRTVIVAGEACSRTLVQHHYGQLPATDLYNEYGPTEATVWCTAYRIPPQLPPGPVAIGRPIPHTQLHLLDQELRPVPTGAMGEIYIGGPGVTPGYLNQPEKTATAFVAPPETLSGTPPGTTSGTPPGTVSGIPPETLSGTASGTPPGTVSGTPFKACPLYKTGDLARRRPDGTLEWLGRCDRQVKIRGYRIELGEIEDVLRSQPEIQTAVVVARPPATAVAATHTPITPTIEHLTAMLTALPPAQAETLLALAEGDT